MCHTPLLANQCCVLLHQVCEGDAAAAAMRAWLPQYVTSLHVDVLKVGEGVPGVEVLRQVMERVKTEDFVLLTGDVVTAASPPFLLLECTSYFSISDATMQHQHAPQAP
jgi:hypothetical protein